MAKKSLFFKSIGGDRKYTADEYVSYFRTLVTDGIPNGGTTLQVTADDTDMTVDVGAGDIWGYGYKYTNDTSETLTIDASDPVNDRIDRIIVRVDLNDGVRSINTYVLKGTPAITPVAPTLTRDLTLGGALRYELSLAQVLIPATSTVVLNANITDERLDETVCGVANSLIQVPTSQFQTEWDAFADAKFRNDATSEYPQEWETWFDSKTAEPGGEFYDEWKAWFDNISGDLPNEASLVSVDNTNFNQLSGASSQLVFESADTAIGDLTTLTTTDKTSLVNAVNEVNAKEIPTPNDYGNFSQEVYGWDSATLDDTRINEDGKLELGTNLTLNTGFSSYTGNIFTGTGMGIRLDGTFTANITAIKGFTFNTNNNQVPATAQTRFSVYDETTDTVLETAFGTVNGKSIVFDSPVAITKGNVIQLRFDLNNVAETLGAVEVLTSGLTAGVTRVDTTNLWTSFTEDVTDNISGTVDYIEGDVTLGASTSTTTAKSTDYEWFQEQTTPDNLDGSNSLKVDVLGGSLQWDENTSFPSGAYQIVASVGTKLYAEQSASPYKMWIYDTLTDTWDESSGGTPSGAYTVDATVVGSKIYIKQSASPYKVWIYDTLTDTWDESSGGTPSGNWEYAETIGTKFYSKQSASPYKVWIYDTLTDTWDESSGGTPSGNWTYPTAYNSKLYVNGLNEIWVYDTTTDTWDESSGGTPSGAWSYPSIVENKIYVKNNASPYNVWVYFINSNTWLETNSSPSANYIYGETIGNKIYRRSLNLNEIAIFDAWETIATETYNQTSQNGVPQFIPLVDGSGNYLKTADYPSLTTVHTLSDATSLVTAEMFSITAKGDTSPDSKGIELYNYTVPETTPQVNFDIDVPCTKIEIEMYGKSDQATTNDAGYLNVNDDFTASYNYGHTYFDTTSTNYYNNQGGTITSYFDLRSAFMRADGTAKNNKTNIVLTKNENGWFIEGDYSIQLSNNFEKGFEYGNYFKTDDITKLNFRNTNGVYNIGAGTKFRITVYE